MVTLPQSRFVKPVGSRFVLEGKDYFVYSANYWQAMNLGSSGPKGDRSKLLQDLDFMKSKGINNLRLMASSEGPDTEPFRMTPSLMTSPGVYNEQVLDGLDFALSEISKRGLTAVLCFNNFWHWSGGFSQYVSWITNTSIPYPPSWSAELGDYTDHALGEIEGSKSWESFIEYSKRFYNDPEVAPIAQNMYFAHVKFILNRRNPYTGLLYCDDPSIFSLELCNEPQTPTFEWCNETAKYFKSLAPNHMVTVGLESKFDQLDFNQAHSSEYIDYCTNHIWVQNRGEYDMLDPREENINHAIEWGIEVVGRCNSWALELCKPLVLEEFGFPRDNFSAEEKSKIYSHENPICNRDRYYSALLSRAVKIRQQGGSYCGFGFWVYSGCSRPLENDWIGDPHHEAPGWYGIYDKDESTLNIMQNIADSASLINDF